MWGGGQAREMEELRPCVCRPVCPLCVCVCVCLGALWAVLVAVRLEGRGARTPPGSPFTGRGALEGFDDVGSDGKRLRRGHRAERRTPGCPEAPALCPQPHLGGEPLLPGAAGKRSLPSG